MGWSVWGILLLGLIGFAAAYSRFREIDIGLRLPSRKAAPLVGLAVLTPIVCVALTKLVGVVTGVPYNSLTKTSVAADAPVLPVLLIASLGLIIGVLRELKRRTNQFSHCFSHAKPQTAETWFQAFASAWNQLI